MNPTPTPLEEIVKEFREKFPNPIYADLTVAGLTSNWNAGKDIEAFLTSKLAAAYNAGIEHSVITATNEGSPNCADTRNIVRGIRKLLLPTDKPI